MNRGNCKTRIECQNSLLKIVFAFFFLIAPILHCLEEKLPSKTPYCFFHAPKEWEIVESRTLSPQVKIAFVHKSKKEGFCPSINLTVEEVEGSLTEYLEDVRAIYEQDRKNHWRKLGKVRTASGDAQLTEIDTISNLGSVRLLQLILLKEGRAYVVTAAALKKDFCSYYRDFQEVFHSLTVTHDLFDAIPQLERRSALKQAYEKLIDAKNAMQTCSDEQSISTEEFEKSYVIPFERKVLEDFDDMGLFWQKLVCHFCK